MEHIVTTNTQKTRAFLSNKGNIKAVVIST